MRTATTRMTRTAGAAWAGLALVTGLGCGVSPSLPATQQRAAEDDAPGALVARPPDRGRVRGGERMQRTVRWPADEARDLAAYEAFEPGSRAAIDAAPVPVLVPGPELALDRREVMQGPEWAAFWGRHEGRWVPQAARDAAPVDVTVTITVHGSRMARVYPGVRPQPGPHTLRGVEAWITRNEGVWSASWVEHGVAYDLGLECAPVDAPPCDDQAELEALVEGLRYAGGQGRLAQRAGDEPRADEAPKEVVR